MPNFNVAGVNNFTMPAPGSASIVTLGFSYGDNEKPFGFVGKPNIPQNFVPQGIIVDARAVNSPGASILIGGTSPFEIGIVPGTYMTYFVPAFQMPVITVNGLNTDDTLTIYACNFPLIPQVYPGAAGYYRVILANDVPFATLITNSATLILSNSNANPETINVELNGNPGMSIVIPASSTLSIPISAGQLVSIGSFDIPAMPAGVNGYIMAGAL